jgi:hypothetical protein
MAKAEAVAEVFLTAIRSLPKRDRERILAGLIRDRNLRQDLLDLAVIEQRRKEVSRHFRQYLKGREEQA